jgi:hypothetical protein
MRQWRYVAKSVRCSCSRNPSVPRYLQLASNNAEIRHVLEPAQFNPRRRLNTLKLVEVLAQLHDILNRVNAVPSAWHSAQSDERLAQ